MKMLHRGAEAVLFLNREECLVKKRVRKGYRIPELDRKIRRQRTKTESNLLIKAKRSGINVPGVVDAAEFEIKMEFLGDSRLQRMLDSMPKKQRVLLYEKIGEAVAALHQAGIMHGDLTTSNMIVKEGEVFLIDFGLAKSSKKVEDQAVDLFLLYEALKAGHFSLLEEAWHGVLKAYKRNYLNSNKVLSQIEKIKQRRRYK